ncbi:hypothetical protein Lbys_2124 [Leadbetterella byssophila DSM 17132]|uniref:Uncharacterized protein n=2 Tax=Leadbetterella TaxID=319458 RepID=E4RTU6_LEAB4|nr:hypothetical protein Lbys_2124 [Leadbetterella byssophila DSM 17132]
MRSCFFMAICLLLFQCTKEEANTTFPYPKLSDYQLFKGEMKLLSPNDELLEFEPTASLFTDYAFKKRFVKIPKDSVAHLPEHPDEPIVFPNETILVKNFYYPLDFSKPEGERKIIETRLLIRTKNTWEAYTYLWNEAQTEALLKNVGATVPVTYFDKDTVKLDYVVPQKTQCRSCHQRDGEMQPIGPKGKQLADQLSRWKALGKIDSDQFTGKKLVPPFDPNYPLEDRARSYLDVNCGHCHSSTGPASTSGLHYNREETRNFHLGVMKSPVAAGLGGGGLKFDIKPGSSEESIVVYRMNSTHPGVMMPELGRVTVHQEAVDLIRAWINSL